MVDSLIKKFNFQLTLQEYNSSDEKTYKYNISQHGNDILQYQTGETPTDEEQENAFQNRLNSAISLINIATQQIIIDKYNGFDGLKQTKPDIAPFVQSMIIQLISHEIKNGMGEVSNNITLDSSSGITLDISQTQFKDALDQLPKKVQHLLIQSGLIYEVFSACEEEFSQDEIFEYFIKFFDNTTLKYDPTSKKYSVYGIYNNDKTKLLTYDDIVNNSSNITYTFKTDGTERNVYYKIATYSISTTEINRVAFQFSARSQSYSINSLLKLDIRPNGEITASNTYSQFDNTDNLTLTKLNSPKELIDFYYINNNGNVDLYLYRPQTTSEDLDLSEVIIFNRDSKFRDNIVKVLSQPVSLPNGAIEVSYEQNIGVETITDKNNPNQYVNIDNTDPKNSKLDESGLVDFADQIGVDIQNNTNDITQIVQSISEKVLKSATDYNNSVVATEPDGKTKVFTFTPTNMPVNGDKGIATFKIAQNSDLHINLNYEVGKTIPVGTIKDEDPAEPNNWDLTLDTQISGNNLVITLTADKNFKDNIPRLSSMVNTAGNPLDLSIYAKKTDIYPNVKDIIKEGTNITIAANDTNKTLTISSSGGGKDYIKVADQSNFTYDSQSDRWNATSFTFGADIKRYKITIKGGNKQNSTDGLLNDGNLSLNTKLNVSGAVFMEIILSNFTTNSNSSFIASEQITDTKQTNSLQAIQFDIYELN